jgi:hypothetical protein
MNGRQRDRVAQIRAQMLKAIEAGAEPFDSGCLHCIESKAVLILEQAREHFATELSQADCTRDRAEHLRRVLALVDAQFDLLFTPAVSGSLH